MVIKDNDLFGEPSENTGNTPTDEPPSYSSIATAGPSTPRTYHATDLKANPYSRPATSPRIGSTSADRQAPATWLGRMVGTPQARQEQEIRATVLNLVSLLYAFPFLGPHYYLIIVFMLYESLRKLSITMTITRPLSSSSLAQMHVRLGGSLSKALCRSLALMGIPRYIGA